MLGHPDVIGIHAQPAIQADADQNISAAQIGGYAVAVPPHIDTSYRERRLVHWDGYIDVRGNRYSVPSHLCGRDVLVRISLDGRLSVYADDMKVAEHSLRNASEGWVSVRDHHQDLWQGTFSVQKRDLSVYEEVGLCS